MLQGQMYLIEMAVALLYPRQYESTALIYPLIHLGRIQYSGCRDYPPCRPAY